MRRVCVFCGSSPGARPAYAEAAEELARLLVADGTGLVYGGGAVGLMGRLADAVLAAGGLGTVEELFEVYTWAQLGLHRKPCGLLDVGGYYEGIASFLSHAVEERFLLEEHRAMLIVEREPRALLERLRRFEPEAVAPKWIDREQT